MPPSPRRSSLIIGNVRFRELKSPLGGGALREYGPRRTDTLPGYVLHGDKCIFQERRQNSSSVTTRLQQQQQPRSQFAPFTRQTASHNE